jgi:hypothetical protein
MSKPKPTGEQPTKQAGEQLPPTLDFGGPIGRPSGIVPPYLRNPQGKPRTAGSSPEETTPSNPFGQKPPDCPSLF